MNPALIAEILSLIGPALSAVSQLRQLFAQPGGPTNDQLSALLAKLKSQNATIQAS